jgi:hypothetical protein
MGRRADNASTCPACGRTTLAEPGTFQICPTCGWVDDPAQSREPDRAEGANGLALSEARWNVAHFGLAFPPSEVGGS